MVIIFCGDCWCVSSWGRSGSDVCVNKKMAGTSRNFIGTVAAMQRRRRGVSVSADQARTRGVVLFTFG